MIQISGVYNNYLNKVNEDITFEILLNVTSPDALSDLHIKIDDGYNAPYENFNWTEIFNPYTASFPYSDQYSMTVYLISSDGTVTTSGMPPFQVLNFQDYDESVIRTYGSTELSLPYTKEDVKIPPNDWSVNTVINESFRKLEENKIYLENIGVIYYPPPYKFIGWLGNKWHIQDIDLDSETFGTGFTSAIDVAVRDDNLLCIADGVGLGTSRVAILSSNYEATFMAEITSKGVNDLFNEIRSIAVDDKNIYVLDAGIGYFNPRVVVFSYDNNRVETTRTEYYWGGYGGLTAKNKYRNPNSMKLDVNGYLWVTDTGNNCVKKYSKTGSWILTITSEHFAKETGEYDQLFKLEEGAPIDTTVDDEGNVHVLTYNYIIKFNNKGQFIKKYDWKIKGTSILNKPVRIISSQDKGIIYVLLDDRILRLSNEGINLGVFGNVLFGNTLTGLNFTGIYHDKHHNLLISNNYSNKKTIIKYADTPKIESVYSNIAYPFNISSVYIDSDEYLNDVVYNKSLQRYYDILDSFRQRLVRKIRYDGVNITISGMLSSEMVPFKYKKSDVFIGTNELVTSDVINRCLNMLYDSEVTLFSMISS